MTDALKLRFFNAYEWARRTGSRPRRWARQHVRWVICIRANYRQWNVRAVTGGHRPARSARGEEGTAT